MPDALYRRARIRAAERGTSLRALVVTAVEDHLDREDRAPADLPRRDRFRTDGRGWPVLRRAPGDTRVVTDELVNRLRDEQGV